jgi:methyltransferase
VIIPVLALAFMLVTMLGELWLSKRNERALLGRGAIEPRDPVYPTMRWAYPLVFLLMAAEGVVRVAGVDRWVVDTRQLGWSTSAGVAVFGFAKFLKYWAIASLGERWTYRVLVLPGAALVSTGPYRWIRHPNYVGVIGELIGMMLVTSAWISGPASVLFFGWLLQQRIESENHALGLDRTA